MQDKYPGWAVNESLYTEIDYYGVTFDHLVPANETNS